MPDQFEPFEPLGGKISKPAYGVVRRTASYEGMRKSLRVVFKFQRIEEGDWQIEAHCPGAETQTIPGFKSKADVDEWLTGSGRLAWLRSQGYAK